MDTLKRLTMYDPTLCVHVYVCMRTCAHACCVCVCVLVT